MNLLKPFTAGSLVVFFFSALTGQTPSPSIKTTLSKKFPDENCIAIKEEVKFTFAVINAGKAEQFVIKEDFHSNQFAASNNFTKNNVVFYDDYSNVNDLVCKKNGRSVGALAIVYTNYEKAEIFHDDVKLCAYKTEMIKNQDYEFSYIKEYRNPRLFSKIYFHESYPIEEKSLVFEVPDWVDIEIKEFNFNGYEVVKTEKPIAAKKSKEIRYTLKSLQAIPNENRKPNMAKTHPHLMVFVKGYKLKSKSENYFSSHADIYKWCKTLADSVDNNPEAFADKLNEIKENETDSLRIMEKVFYWIQDHVRYIAFEDGIMGYKPQAASKVYNMLYGDCKGMANLTKTMLKTMGYDARLTWIGTKDIPYNNDLPSLGVYNHMICTVFLQGKKYFLDGTETFIALDDYAERIQGRPVMIENGNSYLTDVIPTFETQRNKIEIVNDVIIENKIVKGKSKMVLNGEEKTNFLRGVNDIKTENQNKAIKSYIKSGNPDLTVLSFTSSNLSDRKGQLVINSNFEMQNRVFFSADNSEIVLLPEKDAEFENFQFDTTRKSDYEFNNRYYLQSTTNITVPAGYTVKHLPAEVKVSNDTYEFYLNYSQNGNLVIQTKKIIIKNTLLKKPGFIAWNNNVKLLKKFYTEPVILKK